MGKDEKVGELLEITHPSGAIYLRIADFRAQQSLRLCLFICYQQRTRGTMGEKRTVKSRKMKHCIEMRKLKKRQQTVVCRTHQDKLDEL